MRTVKSLKASSRSWLVPVGAALLLSLLIVGIVGAQTQGPGEYTVYLPLVGLDYDSTWRWDDVVSLNLSPTLGYVDPLLAIDRIGQVHILWNPSVSPQFVYHTYLTAQGWTSPTIVARSLGRSTVLHPPVVAPDGRIHLLWRNQETSNDPYRLLYSAFDGSRWSPEEEVYRSAQTYSLDGMVRLDDAGVVHATVVDSDWLSGRIYHIVRSDVSWEPPVEIDGPEHSYWIWPDRWGGVHFYGNDYQSPPHLYYSYWRDGAFLRRDQNAGQIQVSSRQTQLDGANNLHIFWTGPVAISGGQVTGVYYQCLSNALTFTPAEVLSGENSASTVVKGASYAGWATLAWVESKDGSQRLRTAVWDGCTRMYLKSMLLDESWSLLAVAISDDPAKVCVLARAGYAYSDPYRVLCADIVR